MPASFSHRREYNGMNSAEVGRGACVASVNNRCFNLIHKGYIKREEETDQASERERERGTAIKFSTYGQLIGVTE